MRWFTAVFTDIVQRRIEIFILERFDDQPVVSALPGTLISVIAHRRYLMKSGRRDPVFMELENIQRKAKTMPSHQTGLFFRSIGLGSEGVSP